MFLQNSATINCLDSLHQTPLAVAAAYNHVKVIEFLLKRSAQIETQDKNGYTPLLLAASEGNAEAVHVLLQSGANIFCMDKEDRTVLYWASMQNHKNVVDVRKKLLLCYSWSWLKERTKKILNSQSIRGLGSDLGVLAPSYSHNELKCGKKSNFKCVFGWLHDYLKG